MTKLILTFTTALIALVFTGCSEKSEQKSYQTTRVDTSTIYAKGMRGTNYDPHGTTIKPNITECTYKNTVKGYILTVRDSTFGYKSSRIVTIDGPYEPSYEDQTKKIFFDSHNSGQIDSVEIHHYSWVIPENFTPTSRPYRTCTSVEIVKKSKKLQNEYTDLMTTKGIVDGYVKERMSGKYTYKDYEQAENARPYDHNSDNTYVEQETEGWNVNIHDYLWVVRYEINGSSQLAAAKILIPL